VPWTVRVATNLCRDHLRRRKRETYLGPWLPSPLETEGMAFTSHPEARYGELESVSVAFLMALEVLGATQRAVVILRDVLGYSVRDVAEVLSLGESNVKTTHHRARAALAGYDRSRLPLTPVMQERTCAALEALMAALVVGDVAALEALLSDDVRTLHDSAGEYLAARVPVVGKTRVIKLHLKMRRPELPALFVRQLNGLSGLVAQYATAPENVAPRCTFGIAIDGEGRISRILSTVAHRKLSHVRFAS